MGFCYEFTCMFMFVYISYLYLYCKPGRVVSICSVHCTHVFIFQDDIDELNKAEIEKIWPSTDDDHVTQTSEWNPFLSNLSRKQAGEHMANRATNPALDPQLDDFDISPAGSGGQGMPRLPDSVATSTTTVARSSTAVPKSVASSATMISTASSGTTNSSGQGKLESHLTSESNEQSLARSVAQTDVSTKKESVSLTGFSMDDSLLGEVAMNANQTQSKPLEWGDNFGKLGLPPPPEKATKEVLPERKWSKQDAGNNMDGAGDSPEKGMKSFVKSIASEAQAVYDDPAVMKVIVKSHIFSCKFIAL